MLLEAGKIDEQTLHSALGAQKAEGKGNTIGQILLERGAIHREDIHWIIKEQVESTIFELVTWQQGRFHFEVDELHPVDEIGLAPGDLLDDLDLNTQMLLLEATRIFDERQQAETRSASVESPNPVLEERLKRAGFARALLDEESAESDDGRPWQGTVPDLVLEPIRCQVVSGDEELMREARSRLPADHARVIGVPLREAGNRMPGETVAPVVLLDLRAAGLGANDVASLARTRPGASIVALAENQGEIPALLEAGAVAAVAGEASLAVDSCRNLIRIFTYPKPPQGTFGGHSRGGYSRFRRVVYDVQSGLLSATMALNLMHVISESVERAVLFLVQGEMLRAVGAFGFSHRDESLAQLTRGMTLRPGDDSVLRRVIEDSLPLSVDFHEARLPNAFAEMLGPPANGQVVVFPVVGAERPISVIYTDNDGGGTKKSRTSRFSSWPPPRWVWRSRTSCCGRRWILARSSVS